MKYDADVDPAEHNTSHALMLELVGPDKRVLDVGCATGYLARALIAQGCTVSGVEIDPVAAEEARPVLKELVVGDLETLDLRDAFDAGAFEVVVFGDVLEHVTDPLSVLRSSLDLLSDDGCVVVSIPNVAHGSVRLSLLQGRFEYRDLGLLDATHLRFFTRSSVDALLHDAGLVPVDLRRTTADFFETEIPVSREGVAAAVLALLNRDPEARTYQFVVKAVPLRASPALHRLYEENAVQKAEIGRLRRIVAALAGPGASSPGVQVGVWGHFGLESVRAALLPRILRAELVRRLPGSTVRCFAPGVPGSRIDAGEAIEPFGPWSPARADELADELDAVVVTGPLGVPATAYPWTAEPDRLVELDTVLQQGLGPDREQSCPVIRFGVSPDSALATPSDLEPDPLFLVGRVYPPDLLRHRADYLRLMGWYPRFEAAVVVQGDAGVVAAAPALGAALNELATSRGARCVVLESKLAGDDASFANALIGHLDAGQVVPIDTGVVDLLSAVANAEVVVATSPAVLAAAFAFGRPAVGLDLDGSGRLGDFAGATGTPDLVVTRPADIAGALKHAPGAADRADAQRRIEAALDDQLDEVAAVIAAANAARVAAGNPALGAASLASRLDAVEAAHAGLLQRLAAERLAFADRADAYQREMEAVLARAAAAQAEAEAQLAALYATTTMRVLAPARRMYGRIRAKGQ